MNEIWGTPNPRIMTGKSLDEALNTLNVAPDFSYSKPQADTKLLYVHRKLSNSDIYWIDNRKDRVEKLVATFRIGGKVPEIWHAETGKSEPASYRIANGVTKVNLFLQPNDAVFVVFRNKAIKSSVSLPSRN